MEFAGMFINMSSVILQNESVTRDLFNLLRKTVTVEVLCFIEIKWNNVNIDLSYDGP